MPCGTRGHSREIDRFRLQDCHLLWCPFPETSATRRFCNSPGGMQPSPRRPTTPRIQRLHACIYAVWADPRSLAATGGIALAFFSYGYLDVSVPRVGLLPPMYSAGDERSFLRPGFPIRKSSDQSLLAATRGLSQLPTSFIASRRQGIHRTPLVA